MSEIASLFSQLLSPAIADGAAQPGEAATPAATRQPSGVAADEYPPVAPSPGDERNGPLAEPLPPETDPTPEPAPAFTGNGVDLLPTPLIGTVPFGGVVIDAGTYRGPAAGAQPLYVTVGDSGDARPGILGIVLLASGAGEVSILPDSTPGASAGRAGYTLNVPGTIPFPMFIPARRLNLSIAGNASAGRVEYLIIGSNLGRYV